ncbi:hypothetical protein DYB25_000439 [Aphanomyces astaci]|uniref:Uncharacterized protein n=2 Tax=Aphanomyces astaci TaxID=112090 RepID=A0A397C6S1_APHAT|nr:hypothetical protein DYB25_000439 [Aphanomyces astaci]RHY38003.1 hypothetical protein DYB38_007183 [Aphanomyces astaci]RHY95912.1 hypothetical protein DYB31_002498 [Aphanomyces astaci]
MTEARIAFYGSDADDDNSPRGHDESPLTYETLSSVEPNNRPPSSHHMEDLGDDDVDELIKQKRNELYQIKARKLKSRDNLSGNGLNLDDFDLLPMDVSPMKGAQSTSSSAYSTPTKTSLTEIAHRVASNEKQLRSDRMRLTELVSNDSQYHQSRAESASTPRSHRSSPRTTPSPSRQKQLLSQKAIHKWHPDSKRTQVLNQDTPLDIGLSSSEYDGHIGFAPAEEEFAITSSATRRLKALAMELDSETHEDEAEAVVQQVLDFGKYLGGEEAVKGFFPADDDDSSAFHDLQRKMDDMNQHLERLQEEKRLLERQQQESERNATDMSSSLRMLSAQVSQFVNGGKGSGNGAMDPRDLHSSSIHYKEDLMDELKMQRKLMGDLEVEISRWRHDADMLEQSRVLEHQQHKTQALQIASTHRVLDEKVDMQRDAVKALQDQAREWQHKLDSMWDRILVVEAHVLDVDKLVAAAAAPPRRSWLLLVFMVLLLMYVVVQDAAVGDKVVIHLCALMGYDCLTPLT